MTYGWYGYSTRMIIQLLFTNSRLDRNFQSGTAVHLVQRKLEVVQLEGIRDHALHLDLATVKIGNSSGEAVCLRERADNL